MNTATKLLFIPLLGFIGACHGFMHGHDTGKRIDWVASRIEKQLELTPAQKPAFAALVAKVKLEADTRAKSAMAAMRELKTEVDKPALDIDRIAAMAKTRINERASPEQMNAFVDEAAVFLKQLTPQQQRKLSEIVKDKLDWLD